MRRFLTKRWEQVATLIAQGRSSKEIALELELSIKTVQKHRTMLMRRIGAKNAVQVTLWALKNKLVEL